MATPYHAISSPGSIGMYHRGVKRNQHHAPSSTERDPLLDTLPPGKRHDLAYQRGLTERLEEARHLAGMHFSHGHQRRADRWAHRSRRLEHLLGVTALAYVAPAAQGQEEAVGAYLA